MSLWKHLHSYTWKRSNPDHYGCRVPWGLTQTTRLSMQFEPLSGPVFTNCVIFWSLSPTFLGYHHHSKFPSLTLSLSFILFCELGTKDCGWVIMFSSQIKGNVSYKSTDGDWRYSLMEDHLPGIHKTLSFPSSTKMKEKY